MTELYPNPYQTYREKQKIDAQLYKIKTYLDSHPSVYGKSKYNIKTKERWYVAYVTSPQEHVQIREDLLIDLERIGLKVRGEKDMQYRRFHIRENKHVLVKGLEYLRRYIFYIKREE